MTEIPTDAVVYVYVCEGDARPEEHEVRDLLPPEDRWRRIFFLNYTNGSNPESHALARIYSIGPTHVSLVTAGVDHYSRKFFQQVLPPSRAHWIQKARENLETGASLRAQMRTARVPHEAVAQHARQLSVSASRLTKLAERGQSDLLSLITALHEELQLLVLVALKK